MIHNKMHLPALETERLIVRPFVLSDLEDVYRLYDDVDDADRIARRQWLEWTIAGYEQYAALYQPPYGERAICLKSTNEFIGAVGYVPCLNPFGQMPFGQKNGIAAGHRTTEFGLYWSVLSAHRNQGYATEAARTIVEHAFAHLELARIVATTEYENGASQAVMRHLGMRIERNPLPTPPWLQVVGVLERAS